MRFPESEAAVAALVLKIAGGLAEYPEYFPHPPVAPGELRRMYEEYGASKGRVNEAKVALRLAHKEKNELFRRMEEAGKISLRYGELSTRKEPVRLTGLGWAPARDRRRLKAPGEVRNIAVGEQGETTVDLSWNPPVEGGKVAAYEVRRRIGTGKWESILTLAALETTLEDQPRGVQLRYHVVGVNRAGKGQPSGEISVVL